MKTTTSTRSQASNRTACGANARVAYSDRMSGTTYTPKRTRVHAYPKFGARKLTEISTRDIQQFYADMKESHCPATANRHLSVISRMYSRALQWGRVERDPCAGISKFKEKNIRQKLLTSEEIRRMYAAIEREQKKVAVAAIKFLLLTGPDLWRHYTQNGSTLI